MIRLKCYNLSTCAGIVTLKCGILSENIEQSEICTYINPDFYSVRRLGVDSGRFLTGVMLPCES
ncbi:MAG: laccase domain-containing protein [Massilibacteroides sp.]|nr:laccase domain-containing protein [Massilibacteroides sp.]MDD3063881.1 laccase domain-containing protein [Massilibacteroides sp.]MDD4115695.1 laccase domain-containing protein [Massilibacteroides sp.]MDD4661360.1 laccase domain-containing protein [Massilibacteroides sp.]